MLWDIFRLFKRYLTRYDIILIIFLFTVNILSFMLWFGSKPGTQAIIIVDNEINKGFSLKGAEGEMEIQGIIGLSRFKIEGGRIRMLASPCPNKTCIKTGWIGEEGQMICCVPNRIIIKITSQNRGTYDALAR